MGIADFLIKSQVKNFTKGLCFAFKTSYFAAKSKYPNKANIELLCLSLETRPNWEKVASYKYVFLPTNEAVKINKNFTLAELIKNVGFIEINKSLQNLYEDEKQPLIRLFNSEIEKYI